METIQKPRFYAYCRESIDLKSGIEIQKEAIIKYCKAYDIEIIKWFIDNDYSAYTVRPGFDKLWSSLDKCDGIIVNDLSRFGRNDADLLFRFNELKGAKKRIIFIKETIDNTNPESEFFMKLLAIFADRERRLIRERLLAGQAYAKVHGTKSGKPMHRPTKNIDWKQFDEYKSKGLSIPSIAKILCVSKSKLYYAVNKR